MYIYQRIVVVLAVATGLAGTVFADSITLSETWKDLNYSDVFGMISKDTGTLTASLTIPGLSSLTKNDWSNLVVSVSLSPYQGSQYTSDFMADAPNWGGTVTATNATFYFQDVDTNFNLVNVEKVTFGYSGNTLTMTDSALGPPSVQPPFSLLAANYLYTEGPIQDSQTFEIALSDSLDDGSTLNVDSSKILSIIGTNTVTYDSDGDALSSIQVTGAANFTPPKLTQVSPSGSTTTGTAVLADEVNATGAQAIANVEFYWNGRDFGGGSQINSNLWSEIFALTPGTNTLATMATDLNGNNSATNTVAVAYVNPMTNANVIQFSEQYIDTAQLDEYGDTNFAFNQDAGALNAALLVPGLQAMPGATWSNLDLTLTFGNLHFSNNLATASLLTSNSATFYVTALDLNGNPLPVEQLTVTRAGNTLILYKRTSNPTYGSYDNTPIIANLYRGTNTAFHDQRPFSLSLLDGNTLIPYTNYSQTIYITGTDKVSYDSNGHELDNIQVSGQADYTAPVVTITAPTPGQLWSNSVFTVTGKASDNILVTNVLFSVNNGAWAQATTANQWTNWTATANLTPGTNTVAVYAVDSNGNLSPTNQVKLVYIVSALLTVNITGLGTITTNYNGMLLPLGRSYFMTATPAAGFRFTGWTGSLSTNSPTLIFTMASNLVFTAVFADTNIPTLTITNLTAGQHVSNAVFTVRGTAHDNWMVGSVACQINGLGWTNAQTLNNWTNWYVPLNLIPGTNTLQAYAKDTSGNVSLTNTLKFVYILSAPLQLQITGLGTLSPNYSNAVLAIGVNYTIGAAPASGFIFTNWVVATNGVGAAHSQASLQFMMVSNLSLRANFVDVTKPSVTISSPLANQKMTNAIAVIRGTATDNWAVSNVWYNLNSNGWVSAPTTNHWTSWGLSTTLVAGTNKLSAFAVDFGGNYSTTDSVNFVSASAFQLRLSLNGTSALRSNGLAFSLQLSTNLSGHIQYSTNMINWVSLTTFKATNSLLNFSDPAATNSPHRFYRATVP